MKTKGKGLGRRFTGTTLLTGIILLATPASAWAGMTAYRLSDFYRTRLQDISMFLVVLLICSFLLKFLWNYLAHDFKVLPRIKYRQSLALSVIFGLAMLLILTMISGIREVLTPEAWKRQGSGYRLNAPGVEEERRLGLARLRDALHHYASTHDGRFPPHDFVPEIPDTIWETVDYRRSRFVYQPGLTLSNTNSLLAWEPPRFGDKRFGLFVDGGIRVLDAEELKSMTTTPEP